MSLKEAWQVDKLQRQEAVVLRQASVQQVLSELAQARQQMAESLQDDLKQFAIERVQQDQVRRAEFQVFRTALQQHYRSLQAEVQAFLQMTGDRRQVKAQQLAAELAAFVAVLQQETKDLLSTAASDRTLMAQQLAQDLQNFHRGLQHSVRSLRATLQAEVVERQESVQEFLVDCSQWRLEQAEQIQQTLQANRLARTASVAELFHQCAEARQARQQFCHSLRAAVWGQDATSGSQPEAAIAVPVTNGPAVKSIPPQPTPTRATPTRNSVSRKTASPKLAKLVTKSSTKAPATPAKPPTKPASKSSKVTGPVIPAAPTSNAVAQAEVPFEKEVYTFLHTNKGARLTQIEAALRINRFQAVDALRSLIKKGLVTQRDRVYLTQELLASV